MRGEHTVTHCKSNIYTYHHMTQTNVIATLSRGKLAVPLGELQELPGQSMYEPMMAHHRHMGRCYSDSKEHIHQTLFPSLEHLPALNAVSSSQAHMTINILNHHDVGLGGFVLLDCGQLYLMHKRGHSPEEQ